ncbi:MAG TPA: cyclodeaminase/cyclohydrolase family protein [Solirubrobacteraceae bacterium]
MTGPASALDRVAAEIAVASPSGGAGAVAGGVVALAAGLCEAVARTSLDSWPDARGVAVQSAELRRRAGAAAAENATAYAAARAALESMPAGTGRDAALRAALLRAADAPLLIATIAADCTALATAIAQGCEATLRADAVAAAELAAATAQSAAGLVEVNLALLPGDERRERARDAVRAAQAERARARAVLDSP